MYELATTLDVLPPADVATSIVGAIADALPPLAALVSILWIVYQWTRLARADRRDEAGRHAAPAIGQRLRTILRSLGGWLNATLLAMLPFASEIARVLETHLPDLASSLPPHGARWVGYVLVAINIARAIGRARRAVRRKHRGHG